MRNTKKAIYFTTSKITLVFIVSGDGYPVAGVSWTQLTTRIRNHEHLARNAAHIWVLELAYCGASNLKDLRRVWKKNLRVSYFFEIAFVGTFERLNEAFSSNEPVF